MFGGWALKSRYDISSLIGDIWTTLLDAIESTSSAGEADHNGATKRERATGETPQEKKQKLRLRTDKV